MSGQPPRKPFPSFAGSCYAPFQPRESEHKEQKRTVRIDTEKNTVQIIPARVTSGPPTEVLSQELKQFVETSVERCVQYYVQQYMQQYMQQSVQQVVEQYATNNVLPNLDRIVELSVQNAMRQLAPQSASTPAPVRATTPAPVLADTTVSHPWYSTPTPVSKDVVAAPRAHRKVEEEDEEELLSDSDDYD